MLKKSSKYWLDRQAMEKEAIEKYIEQDQEAIAQLNKHYDTMQQSLLDKLLHPQNGSWITFSVPGSGQTTSKNEPKEKST